MDSSFIWDWQKLVLNFKFHQQLSQSCLDLLHTIYILPGVFHIQFLIQLLFPLSYCRYWYIHEISFDKLAFVRFCIVHSKCLWIAIQFNGENHIQRCCLWQPNANALFSELELPCRIIDFDSIPIQGRKSATNFLRFSGVYWNCM